MVRWAWSPFLLRRHRCADPGCALSISVRRLGGSCIFCKVSNRAIFDQFFADLGQLKIDNVVNAFAEDGYYQDMPVATDPTVGRDAIRKKLTFLTAAQQ